ncbi:MAG: glycosyltransferase [Bacteroidota bacterium]
MTYYNIENTKTILLCILNWGLGHATRCVPLIQQWQAAGHRVVLASDGRALELLRIEFPDLTCLPLPAHNIRYANRFFEWSIFFQLPKIALITLLEHFKVRVIVKQYGIEEIVSDNRYGCFHPKKRSIFITHQLNIIIPNPVLQNLARSINKRWIKTFFEACWIPDCEEEPNLSGLLSHGTQLPQIRFIGLLSRMQPLKVKKQYDWVAVLSGPEPQRTHLEELIIAQAKRSDKHFKAVIVGGKSEKNEQYFVKEGIEYCSFLATKELNQLFCAAKVVICRSGYSTLMDLAATKSQGILIPTPKQTEQTYLAQHFLTQKIFFSQSQADFDLEVALARYSDYTGLKDIFNNGDSLYDF